jgi:uncharacterized protein YbaP (TraB family)
MLLHVVNAPTYLLGSSHYLPPAHHQLSPAVWQIVHRSARLVFEVNPEELKEPPPILKLPQGHSLRERIPASMFTKTSALWHLLIGDAEPLNEYQIWAVTLKLSLALIHQHSGLSRDHGVDNQLLRKARERGLTPYALEHLELFELMDSAPLTE